MAPARLELITAELTQMYDYLENGEFSKALSVLGKIRDLDSLYNDFPSEIEELERRIKKAANEYNVGDIGPAYGIIFYDCDADNDKGNADGLISSECGWRYLEAAPSVVFIDEDGDPMVTLGFLYSSSAPTLTFGFNRNESGKDVFVNNSTKYSTSNCTSTRVGTGKKNTALLVNSMKKNSAYSVESKSSSIVWGMDKYNAAEVCDLLAYSIDGSDFVFDDWYLPSRDELKLLLTNLDCNLANNNLPYGRYWSSSEDPSDPELIWTVKCPYQPYNYGDDRWGEGRYNRYFVRPIRSF